MKNAIIITAIAGLFVSSCGDNLRESSLPSVVVNSVKGKYTMSEKIEWKKKAGGFEAEFMLGKVETSVFVDSVGNILMQKHELQPAGLPSAVSQVISASYKDYTIEEANKLEKNGVVNYQVELDGKGSNKDLELVFSPEGKIENNTSFWK